MTHFLIWGTIRGLNQDIFLIERRVLLLFIFAQPKDLKNVYSAQLLIMHSDSVLQAPKGTKNAPLKFHK